MSIALAAIMGLAAVAIVAWPLLRRLRPGVAEDDASGEAEGLQRARAGVYHEIRQLETDRASGLVEDDDYQAQRQDLRVAAARLMESEARSSAPTPEEQLEREIEAARGGRAGGGSKRGE